MHASGAITFCGLVETSPRRTPSAMEAAMLATMQALMETMNRFVSSVPSGGAHNVFQDRARIDSRSIGGPPEWD